MTSTLCFCPREVLPRSPRAHFQGLLATKAMGQPLSCQPDTEHVSLQNEEDGSDIQLREIQLDPPESSGLLLDNRAGMCYPCLPESTLASTSLLAQVTFSSNETF